MHIDRVELRNMKKIGHRGLVLSILSPERLLRDSVGEVLTERTLNVRENTYHPRGLFSVKIFGKVGTLERRRNIGHIKLSCTVPHPWYLKYKWISSVTSASYNLYYFYSKNGSKDLSKQKERFPTMLEINEHILLNSDFYYDELSSIDMVSEYLSCLKSYESLARKKNVFKKDEYFKIFLKKKIQILGCCISSGQHIKWMFLTVLPILPPDLRPIMRLSNGLFLSSELNQVYREIILKNKKIYEYQRLIYKNSLQLGKSLEDRFLEKLKVTLREEVIGLLDRSCYENFFSSRTPIGRELKEFKKKSRYVPSLTERLHGKEGRFRHDVLGKRVNYSGRSVICSGPRLRINECGLPFELVLKIFYKIFLYKLLENNMLLVFRNSRNYVKKYNLKNRSIFSILSAYLENHPILLNRAPTLHKYNIQAFTARLVSGRSILLHPLVCSSFNADFDGDTMAVHFPLSIECQVESRLLMHTSFNLMGHSSGKAMIVPSQDVVFGLYYLTIKMNEKSDSVNSFYSFINKDRVSTHKKSNSYMNLKKNRELVLCLKNNLLLGLSTIHESINYSGVDTTLGRVLLYNLFSDCSHGWLSKKLKNDILKSSCTKSQISKILTECYKNMNIIDYSFLLDQVMSIGFYYSNYSSITVHKNDISTPNLKSILVQKAKNSLPGGGIGSYEYVKCWLDCLKKVNRILIDDIEETKSIKKPSIYLLVDSGARGSMSQVQQLSGMRGLMVKSSGELLEFPILSNFKEGLNSNEYYNSIYGSRKGVIDTSLKTAASGYLTRKLVYSAKNSVIMKRDCFTESGLLKTIYSSGNTFYDDIKGSVTCKNVYSPVTGHLILERNTLINEEIVNKFKRSSIGSIVIRSPITCNISGDSLCQMCYGEDFSRNHLVDIDTPVGMIAAQSIGEPGTQLTMRTFHQGGAASADTEDLKITAPENSRVFIYNEKGINSNEKNRSYEIGRYCKLALYRVSTIGDVEYTPFFISKIAEGSIFFVKDGDYVRKGELICYLSLLNTPVISKENSLVFIRNLQHIKNSSFMKNSSRKKSQPIDIRILYTRGNSDDSIRSFYFLGKEDKLLVKHGDFVKKGTVLFLANKNLLLGKRKGDDITGGLSKISKFFEASDDLEGILCPFDGSVKVDTDIYGNFRVRILFLGKKGFSYNIFSGKSFSYLLREFHRFSIRGNEFLYKGDSITKGSVSARKYIELMGLQGLIQYIEEIRKEYFKSGVNIKGKHFECIVRCLSTGYNFKKKNLYESISDGCGYNLVHTRKKNHYTILGVTPSGLLSSSFFTAASFQRMSIVLSKSTVSNEVEVLSESTQGGLLLGCPLSLGTGNQHIMKYA